MPDQPLCVCCRKQPVKDRWRPFCSERCKMVDLGRWLSGNYRIPVRQDQDGETDASDGSAEPHQEPDDEP